MSITRVLQINGLVVASILSLGCGNGNSCEGARTQAVDLWRVTFDPLVAVVDQQAPGSREAEMSMQAMEKVSVVLRSLQTGDVGMEEISRTAHTAVEALERGDLTERARAAHAAVGEAVKACKP